MSCEESDKDMADKPQIELRCQVDTAMLNLLREFVCSVARNLGFSETQVAEIEISVDEACANAVEHAYRARPESGGDQDIMMEILFSDNHLTIRVIDRGLGAKGLGKHLPNLEEYLDMTREKYRGLGLLLMQKFMDKVDVKSTPEHGTMVELTKIRK